MPDGSVCDLRALFSKDIINFIQHTQPKFWERLSASNKGKAETILLDTLEKELQAKGMLTVLRHGFKCFGKTAYLVYFAPNTGMNPEAEERYNQNRLTITRQVNTASGAIPDVVLAINGLPVVSCELKNPTSGQTAEDAKRQYRNDRGPKERLFSFKERCLVHFAVDTDWVFMTTKLAGKSTVFLPFNRGHNHSDGNPPVENDWRTGYLWREVLNRESLLDIFARFLHLETQEKTVTTNNGVKREKKETLIFPRYHQLDAVRKLVNHAQNNGSGHNYLVQHSAGSGKSNSIAWLAHRLSNLHDANDNKIFHSVIVITDRVVLDDQLQKTIYQFEHKQGVVQKIDEGTQQLAKALSGGVPIIVSTLQKFPFISQAIKTMEKKGETVDISTEGKRFAVIVDEAHSSQSGEMSMELKKILNQEGIESAIERSSVPEAIAEQLLDLEEEEEDLTDKAKQAMLREQLKRSKQPNLSFFAFTATPKYKTLLVFDEAGENGKSPFHLYSMRQAIEEGFILDVLQNYTHYKRYYHLVQTAVEDQQLPRRKAARALARFVDLHDHNINQKIEIIVEHFRTYTRHKIGGKAKAMVVTNSREHAVRYKLAFDKYLQANNYTDIRSLVAFSGKVQLDDFSDDSFSEVGMNEGIKEKELPEKFASDDYQVLLVADKYQTGFDQPLLHTMYIDKRLSGIRAVQTLSRLNRIAPGKQDTFVLDFVNEPEEIYKAFNPYYEVSEAEEEPDPHRLDQLAYTLQQWQIFDSSEIDQWCEIWYRNRANPTGGEHQKLNNILDRVIDRYTELEEEEQALFKSQFISFRNLYLFLSQIIPYSDSELEKLYTFGRYLLSKLPRSQNEPAVKVDDEVELKYYRLQKISEGSIDLRQGETNALSGPKETGTRRQEEDTNLSSLIDKLNERHGTEFTLADQLFFDQVQESAIANESLRQAAKANAIEDFEPVFKRMLESLFVERIEGNEEIFARVMNDEELRENLSAEMIKVVYERIVNE
ncbi:MAG: DEAD/DEAH box helicase family protein [Cyanobacteria bacterium]|jgi:type I restriction enzyme R subunit|nr:DEAD/DEAH box helicase family protein [Cyanobacteria bacterium GSL.Bin21]